MRPSSRDTRPIRFIVGLGHTVAHCDDGHHAEGRRNLSPLISHKLPFAMEE